MAAYADAKGPHYIIATQDETLQVSKLGRHGKGTTLFPTDADGNYMKELDGRAVDIYEVTPKGRYKLIYSKGRLLQI